MAYDLNRVQLEFRETCRKAQARSGLNVPIKLNGRLTRTLGRVTLMWDSCENCYYPSLVEFSKKFIETSTDESIKDVILHEAAHLIATERTGENHGHDSYFKSICAEIGTSNDGMSTKVNRTVAEDKVHKYSIYCETCHKVIGYRDRKCAILEHIDECSCKLCGTHNLKVIQNW